MCGISAVIGRGWERDQLQSMVNAQSHRGPDFSGLSILSEGYVGLGHNRLSIIDRSAGANQPMPSSDGSITLVFNGEIYNYKEIKQQLSEYRFRTESDTEVVLASYEKWGERCLERMQGMFAFVLWNARTNVLFAARDRLGIKPLYYCSKDGCLWITSEIKGLLASGFEPSIDLNTVHDYLRFGLYDHGSSTFFSGIRSLPQASLLRFSNDRVSINTYWSLEEQTASDTWEEELHELMHESVRLHLQSDVPVGLHLTGGLDSTILARLVAEHRSKNQPMFSYTGIYGDCNYDEAAYARHASDEFGFEHRSCALAASDFWSIAWQTQVIQDEPFGGLPTMVYVPLESTCREQGTVVLLEGQGGDELFGGYAYYFSALVEDLLSAGLEREAHRVMKLRASVLGIEPENVLPPKNSNTPLHQDGTKLNSNDCLTEEFRSRFAPPEFSRPFSSSFANVRYQDIFHRKLPRVLRFNDRMSMAFGRELRVPYLDHRIVELAFRIPVREFFSEGLGKEPLRSFARNSIPESLRVAGKRPVGSPQREWIRGVLSSEASSILERSPLWKLGILDRDRAIRCANAFLAGVGDNSFQFWQWLNLSIWIEQKIEGRSR